jgi:hypothetical protein
MSSQVKEKYLQFTFQNTVAFSLGRIYMFKHTCGRNCNCIEILIYGLLTHQKYFTPHSYIIPADKEERMHCFPTTENANKTRQCACKRKSVFLRTFCCLASAAELTVVIHEHSQIKK